MRAIRLTLAALACVLLAGCGTDDVIAPETEARFTDTDCIDCAPPNPPPPYTYGSDTDVSHPSPGHEARHEGRSWTVINDSWLASGRVDATSYLYKYCYSFNRQPYQTASQTVYGIGRAEVRFTYITKDVYGFQVKGTHRITPRPGYTGGGTFYTEASHCDNYQ